MKKFYGLLAVATLAGLGVLCWGYGWAAGLMGAGLWVVGFGTHKHRHYVRLALETGKTSFTEKARAWIRGR